MSEHTHIAWCDSTVNFWEGCTKVSPGCANCYAEHRDSRMMIEKVIHWGKGAPRRKVKTAVQQALALNRKPWVCDHCGTAQRGALAMDEGCDNENCVSNLHEVVAGLYHRRLIFSLSLGDWLDPEVPIGWLAEMLDTIRKCDQVNWLLLTKQAGWWLKRMDAVIDAYTSRGEAGSDKCKFVCDWESGKPPHNVWISTSVEDQERTPRIADLLSIPARVHFLSLEPLLGPLDILHKIIRPRNHRMLDKPELPGFPGIDWVIIGGESGPGARPCGIGWVRDIKDQCRAARVPCFVKQLGSNPLACFKRFPLNHPKGGDPTQWPEDLRVREFPTV